MHEQKSLLKTGEGAEVDRGKSAHDKGTDTIEKSINVADVILAVGRIENCRENEGTESAGHAR